ncbi:nucleotide exchange factor GrpE [Allokutzneria sp. A3M-2-11 16]|uniref:nucleotide exchange factor GrpE n=1 Tax=Allokutzneria sp. A3M-2-11 16 TaxID=2962043 RepID=UPI0020B7B7DB|nr:nucleotide exchange factor GrpE [Allokutzneria sp. A3M-2-11 16]MCP3799430.1 nucleotide exchange factor GrpE [Allokutzneria sp. A3M-2-11 16]
MSGPEGTESGTGSSETDMGSVVNPDNAVLDTTEDVERRKLVQLCLYALDRARSAGVADRIEEGLAEVGVVAVRPDGERFDPAHHEAGGTLPTDDPDLDGLVAETEVVGFTDNGRWLRAPIVTVYTRRSGASEA